MDSGHALERALRAGVRGTVDFGPQARALHSMDASNYRHVPPGVVVPRDTADVVAAVAVCRAFDAPLTMRGGGTSIGGQATGRGVVLDVSRHLTRIHDIDTERRIASVEPGVVLDDLRAAAAVHGLTFGPDPSTHSRCTIGGMIGNDACGSHSVAWGRTSANIEWLDVLTPGGDRMRIGPGATGDAAARPYLDRLAALTDANLALIRRQFPSLPRRVSGYALDRLLPENGRDVARALVGTEGTCAVVLGAGVRLVPAPRARALAVLGFADDVEAADAAPALLPHGPLTVESLSAGLAALSASAQDADLPDAGAWLFVEAGGDTADEAASRAKEFVTALDLAPHRVRVVTDPAAQRALWRIREEAAGTATRNADGSEAWPGWEDTAVEPSRLGSYLRELGALMGVFGLRGMPYGHFGEGCVHIRLDFDLMSPQGTAVFREFSSALADLVVAHGGSLSGEHGDGQARSEFLPRMYSPEILRLFEQFKGVWDPDGRMNPGVLVRPRPVDADLRFTGLPRTPVPVAFGYPDDAGDFAAAVRRCVGVGKCRETTSTAAPGGVMCPSFRATREEKHSTRGRARLLHEMLVGDVVTDGWRSEEVRDALDLCLSCKGCRSDCPVDVDVATYKAEFLHHHYAGRVRPAAHYALGWLPTWARAVEAVPGAAQVINAAGRVGPLRRGGMRALGLDAGRPLPVLAPESFTRWWARRPRVSGGGPRVVLWPDTFTNRFAPQVARAAVTVLEDAGLEVVVPPSTVCCGLTWVSTGQLDRARSVMRRTLRILAPALDAGLPVVGLEPSCTAALRTDVPELVDGAGALAGTVRTFAQALEEFAPGWEPPCLDREIAGQTHCHQHAVLGDAAERTLRERAGLHGELTSGCCGLAGNFGYEAGHREVSVAVAEDRLLPALRAAPRAQVLADGFSCRTQIAQLADRDARHLAELLAEGVAVRRHTR